MADITTEIWPVSSRQIAEKDHSSDLDKDVVPSSSEGQMMIGGEGSREGVEDRFARRDWEKCTAGGLGGEKVQGGRRPMHVSGGRGREGRRFRVDQIGTPNSG
jgi:hypothetical protein